MRNQQSIQELENEWERAVERAAEQEERATQLRREDLNDAAGLRVKAGVKSGAWTNFTDSGCPL